MAHERLRRFLGIATTVVVSNPLSSFAVPAKTNPLQDYLDSINERNPFSELLNEDFEKPTLREYLELTYKENTQQILEKLEQYRKENPDINYLANYKEANLDAKIPRIEAPSDIVGRAGPQGVELSTDERTKDIYTSVDAHEMIHRAGQMNSPDYDEQSKAGRPEFEEQVARHFPGYFSNTPLTHLAHDYETGKPEAQTEEGRAAFVRLQITNPLYQYYEYLLNPIELEPRLSLLKELNHVVSGETVDSPEASVRAMQRFGFDLDPTLTANAFEQMGLEAPTEALKTKPLPKEVLQFVAHQYQGVEELRQALNGVWGYSDTSTEIQKPPGYTRNLPNLKDVAPDMYQWTIIQFAKRTPGLAMNQAESPDIGNIA